MVLGLRPLPVIVVTDEFDDVSDDEAVFAEMREGVATFLRAVVMPQSLCW